MVRRHNWHILSVIAKVKDDEVKVSEQVLPVGKIGVSGEAITMGKEQTDAICAAMTPHKNGRAIVERNVKRHFGSGQFVVHWVTAQLRFVIIPF